MIRHTGETVVVVVQAVRCAVYRISRCMHAGAHCCCAAAAHCYLSIARPFVADDDEGYGVLLERGSSAGLLCCGAGRATAFGRLRGTNSHDTKE